MVLCGHVSRAERFITGKIKSVFSNRSRFGLKGGRLGFKGGRLGLKGGRLGLKGGRLGLKGDRLGLKASFQAAEKTKVSTTLFQGLNARAVITYFCRPLSIGGYIDYLQPSERHT